MSEARNAVERMTKIWASIYSGECPTATTLAKQFEVTTKTIHRDIDFLRDRIQLPIRWSYQSHGWETFATANLPWWIFPKHNSRRIKAEKRREVYDGKENKVNVSPNLASRGFHK